MPDRQAQVAVHPAQLQGQELLKEEEMAEPADQVKEMGIVEMHAGGGGGGAYIPDNSNHNGGSGAAGQIRVTYLPSITGTLSVCAELNNNTF